MGVQVHIPVRLRVDPPSLLEHPDIVDAAVQRAVRRALRRSRAEIGRRFGGYLATELTQPLVRWSGDALPEVPESARPTVAARVTRLIASVARSTLAGQRLDAPRPLVGRPAEPFDPRRRRPFGRYVVDSYDTGGARTVAIDGGGEDAPEAIVWDVGAIRELRSHSDWETRVWERLADEPSFTGNEVRVGAVGLLVSDGAGWRAYIAPAVGNVVPITFGAQRRRRPVRRGDRILFVEETSVPPPTVARLVEHAIPEGDEDRLALMETLFAERLLGELRSLYDPTYEAAESPMTAAEVDEAIEGAVREELVRRARALRRSRALLVFDWGEVRFYIGIPESLAPEVSWSGQASVFPATTLGHVRPARIGTGEESGSGSRRPARGDAGRAGGGADGGGGQAARGERFGVAGGAADDSEAWRHFPSFGTGEAAACVPFLDAEPDPAALGPAGAVLAGLVAQIAERLDLAPCRYAATFCVTAASAIEGIAYDVGRALATDTGGTFTTEATRSSGGGVAFRPAASPALQLLRRLAQATRQVAELQRFVTAVFLNGTGAAQLGGRYRGNAPAWVLRFLEATTPALRAGVAAIFTQTCRVVLLQLLVASAEQIGARRRNLRAYAAVFQQVMVRSLSNLGTLTTLRDRLRAVELAHEVQQVTPPVGGIPGVDWVSAARAVADACVATEGFAHMPGRAQEIVWRDGTASIRDDHGFLWTRAALEAAILRTRGRAESLDPLIQQLSGLPDVVARFRSDPRHAEALLEELLDEMARLNAQKQNEARSDPLYGLQAGQIVDASGALDRLSGIHALADREIAEFFRGDPIYRDGISYAFSVELGTQGLATFFEVTGLVLLAVVCPPAAFVAGMAVAARDVARAEARADLYRALIDPELVLNRAEIELEQYVAYLGAVLALAPEAMTAIRAVSIGVRGGARRGAVAGLRLAGRSVLRVANRQIREALQRELVLEFARELGTNLAMDQVLPWLTGPVIERLQREIQLRTTVGGTQGAAALIRALERSAEQRIAAPLPGEAPAGDAGEAP